MYRSGGYNIFRCNGYYMYHSGGYYMYCCGGYCMYRSGGYYIVMGCGVPLTTDTITKRVTTATTSDNTMAFHFKDIFYHTAS